MPLPVITIDTAQQRLTLAQHDAVIFQTSVSTAKKGVGEQKGSERTPRGWHIIRAKIGEGLPENSVFVGRRPTGEIYGEDLARQYPERDWVLTRILWLSGLEIGKNRLGNVDTMQRYIYLHGCPDSLPMGIADSHGCIRLRNRDMIDLFSLTPIYTRVIII